MLSSILRGFQGILRLAGLAQNDRLVGWPGSLAQDDRLVSFLARDDEGVYSYTNRP